jgi:hypothetical protein
MGQEVKMKISVEKLAELFSAGLLCAADFQCLDCDSRDAIQQLCLKSCALQSDEKCQACLNKCSGYWLKQEASEQERISIYGLNQIIFN